MMENPLPTSIWPEEGYPLGPAVSQAGGGNPPVGEASIIAVMVPATEDYSEVKNRWAVMSGRKHLVTAVQELKVSCILLNNGHGYPITLEDIKQCLIRSRTTHS